MAPAALMLVLFLLPTVAASVDSSYTGKCKCFPNKISGDAYTKDGFLHAYYIDYERNQAFEDWRNGSTHLLDLTKMISYNFESNSCRSTERNIFYLRGYLQCPPDNAVVEYEGFTAANGDKISSFWYGQNNKYLKWRLYYEKNCLPIEMQEWIMDGDVKNIVLDITMMNEVASVDDSIFDNVDISKCNK